MKNLILLLFVTLLLSCQSTTQKNEIQIKGELKKWHKVTLNIPGPEVAEWDEKNPFLNYKLEVTFTNGQKSYTVPGFFAADGNAAETSADVGNTWKVRFRPDATGTWNYKVSFQEGENIVVKDDVATGEPLSVDGSEGSFEIEESDKTGDDFRAKGRIVNGGDGYFEFQETGETWIKNGADSPENFLAFAGF
ncbi:MAG: DUF5060 domain-containing protein, partial [Tangfeifania sp.]